MERVLITLTVSESKRLIARGIIEHPEVQRALNQGTVIIAGGTTNGYILEELTGENIDKELYTAGVTCEGKICVTSSEDRLPPAVFKNGQKTEKNWNEALKDFSGDDVFIKGANALDLEGNAGILMGSPTGGTIGAALPIVTARGSSLIMPVGLEKLIPSVPEAASLMGIESLSQGMGMKVGMLSVSFGEVFTELEAIEMLCGVEAISAAAGGIGGSEGSQTLLLLGNKEEIDDALKVVENIKGEPPLPGEKRQCPCANECLFPDKPGKKRS